MQSENKDDRPHLVPLNALAISVIENIPNLDTNRRLFFSTNGQTPILGFSKIKRRLDDYIGQIREERKDESSFSTPWTLHDLRRTITAHLRKQGNGRDVCSAILNHAERGVTAVHYDQYDMLDEKKIALKSWGGFVQSLL